MNLQALLTRTNQFLYKAERVHKPLTAFKDSTGYRTLRNQLTRAIAAQAKAVADALPDADVLPAGIEPLSSADIAILRQWIDRTMPPLASLVEESTVRQVMTDAFVHGAKSLYRRWGVTVKRDASFTLTNPDYLAMLRNQSNYLLNKSGLDDTTLNRLVDIIASDKEAGLTNDEVAADITDQFESIADYRADMITRTEVAKAMNGGDLAAMTKSGVATKAWVAAGNNPCPICVANEDDGYIGVDDYFNSGDTMPPAHPNCECYLDAGQIDLDSIDIWAGE